MIDNKVKIWYYNGVANKSKTDFEGKNKLENI
jgi:hypothetical protein